VLASSPIKTIAISAFLAASVALLISLSSFPTTLHTLT
jgi:hypothetical protein